MFDEKKVKCLEETGDESQFKKKYTWDEIKKAMISVIRDTKSYFDNNMKNTAIYWIDMYEQQFREAESQNSSEAILPSDKKGFDIETCMFDIMFLKNKRLLSNPDSEPKSMSKEDYLEWLDDQYNAAYKACNYNAIFRWILAKEIFKLKNGR